jgi:hypothetical protein
MITIINDHNNTLLKKEYHQKGLFTVKYEKPAELTYHCTCYKLGHTGDWMNFKACTKQLDSLGKKGSKEPEFTIHNCPATMIVQIFNNGVHGIPFHPLPHHLCGHGAKITNVDICGWD